MKRIVVLLAAVLALATPRSAHATIILFDSFDSENAGAEALNYNGFANFTIAFGTGTVDLIGNGGVFDFLPGNGLYVDLDGSTNDAGFMMSDTLSLLAGNYNLSFDLAGSQRPDGSNTVDVVLFGSTFLPVLASYTVASGDPFTSRSIPFSVPLAGVMFFVFQNSAPAGSLGDNQGALLDNVLLQTVPEPAALILFGLAALAIAARARRAKVSTSKH